jgi:dolichol kinase
MNKDLQNFIWFSVIFLTLFASAEVLYRLVKIKAEYTRKYVHIGSGLVCFAFPYYFTNHWWVLAICAAFLGLLLLSFRFPNLLPSINAVKRTTAGSPLYPVAVYVSFLASVRLLNINYFFAPMATMALADPVAELVGRRWGKKQYTVFDEQKSWAGSLAFLAVACAVNLVLFGSAITVTISLAQGIAAIFFIALVATVAEAIGIRGTDNLLIPAAVIFAMLLVDYFIPVLPR